MKANHLQDVFQEELCDILDAEDQLLKALPRLAEAAECDALREGFEAQLRDSNAHYQRIERIFEIIGIEPAAKKCEAMAGLVKEGKQAISLKTPNGHLRDKLLICNAKKLDCYQMSSYGSLKKWAGELGLNEAADLLNSSYLEARAAEERFDELDVRESEEINHGTDKKGTEKTPILAFEENFIEPPIM